VIKNILLPFMIRGKGQRTWDVLHKAGQFWKRKVPNLRTIKLEQLRTVLDTCQVAFEWQVRSQSVGQVAFVWGAYALADRQSKSLDIRNRLYLKIYTAFLRSSCSFEVKAEAGRAFRYLTDSGQLVDPRRPIQKVKLKRQPCISAT